IVKNGVNNQPEFDLVYPVAWDYITWKEQYASIINQSEAFIFGSLSARNHRSYQALRACLNHSRLNVFDVNIRPPHFNQSVLEDLLRHAHLLKLNNAELALLNSWY